MLAPNQVPSLIVRLLSRLPLLSVLSPLSFLIFGMIVSGGGRGNRISIRSGGGGVASCITITICGGASDSNTAKAGDKEVQCFDEDFELLQDVDRGLSNVSVNFI